MNSWFIKALRPGRLEDEGWSVRGIAERTWGLVDPWVGPRQSEARHPLPCPQIHLCPASYSGSCCFFPRTPPRESNVLLRRLDGKQDCSQVMSLHKLSRLCQADAQIDLACSSQNKPGMGVPLLVRDATSPSGVTCLSPASPCPWERDQLRSNREASGMKRIPSLGKSLWLPSSLLLPLRQPPAPRKVWAAGSCWFQTSGEKPKQKRRLWVSPWAQMQSSLEQTRPLGQGSETPKGKVMEHVFVFRFMILRTFFDRLYI